MDGVYKWRIRRARKSNSGLDQSYGEQLKRYSGQSGSADPGALPMLWWHTPRPGNFGDWLAPVLFETAFAVKPRLLGRKSLTIPHVFGIGSIAKFANHHTTIIGSGISAANQEISSLANLKLARGPMTALAYQANQKTKLSIPLGDPGILLGEILDLPSPALKEETLAFIPHYVHEGVPIRLGEGFVRYQIWASNLPGIRELWSRLQGHSGVVTSSLHAFIGAQALGIPVALINLDTPSNKISGDGTKFADYALGVGVSVPERIAVQGVLTHNFAKSLLTTESITGNKKAEVKTAITTSIRNFLEMKDDGRA